MIQKIISGGQTGADRAALDVAFKLGIPHGEQVVQILTDEDRKAEVELEHSKKVRPQRPPKQLKRRLRGL